MTPRLLELLVCLACKGELALRAKGAASGDVPTTTLTCSARVAAYPIVQGIRRSVGQDWYSSRYQWKHRYSPVLRWFRETGFSDLYVAGEPIRVRGLKVSAP